MCRQCLPVRARPLLSLTHSSSLLRLVQSQPVEYSAPIYSPTLLLCLRGVVLRWRDLPSAGLSRNRAHLGGAYSQRETRYVFQVLHNIRLSSALLSASRSIESSSVIVSRSPPMLTMLHPACCDPHNSPPMCPSSGAPEARRHGRQA